MASIQIYKKIIGISIICSIFFLSCGSSCGYIEPVNSRGSEIKQEVLNLIEHVTESKLPFDKPVGLYYTLSNSGAGTGLHFQVPFFIRMVKPTGINFIALAYYRSSDANTTVVNNRGDIIFEVHGKHAMFLHGFGLISFNGYLFNSRLLIAGVSVFPPIIIQ